MLFFLISCCFQQFFYKSCRQYNEDVILKLALAIPTGVPITVANDTIEMLPLVADKTIKDLSK